MKKSAFKKVSHFELELKFELLPSMDITPRTFLAALWEDFELTKVKTAISPDVYYRQGDNVLRFRANRKHVGGELTVKLRTSKKSITNRVEIDLLLAKKTSDDDVRAFLMATGWEPELHLEKCSHIVHIGRCNPVEGKRPSPPTVIALYTVHQQGSKKERTFLEVELDKDALESIEGAHAHLDHWHQYFMQKFERFPTEAINQSLYELYTGNQYRTV